MTSSGGIIRIRLKGRRYVLPLSLSAQAPLFFHPDYTTACTKLQQVLLPCARHFICRRHTIEFAAGHVIKFPVQLYGCTAMIICFLHPYPKQRHTASSDTLSPRRAGSQLSWLYRWPLNIGSGKSAQRLGIWCSENKGYYITAIRSASSITTNIVTEKIAVNALMIFSFIFRFSPQLKAPNIPSVNKGKYA